MSASPHVPIVSVLIPCWNAAGSIGRALDSVLVERGFPIECVVVDDGSTDGTPDIVRSIARGDPRVVLIALPANVGPSAARNHGLRAIRGEWLTGLDADDRLLPGGLAALYRAAVATDALAVVGQRVWSDGERTWIGGLYDRPDIRVPGRKSLRRNPGLMYYASVTGKLVHRSCREDLWFTGRVLGDQPWILRALLRAGDRIEVIADDVYEWSRPRPGNDFQTITAAKRRSARLATEAVRVAIGAFAEVAEEAKRVIPDPAGRRVISSGYFDRLVRADFAGSVARAAAGGDEGTVMLYDAITDFLRGVPPEAIARSRVVAISLVLPPLLYWRRLAPDGRAAAWSMLSTLAEADQTAHGVPGARRVAWGLLARLCQAGRGRARPLVDAGLAVVSLVAAAPLAIWARRHPA